MEQKRMFDHEKTKRREIYHSIFENLTISDLGDGFSCLRRLEIRYLPLDPLLVEQLFKALSMNVILQELILTDDCLQFCDKDIFTHLFNSLKVNTYSGLTMLDFSRNLHTFNNNIEVHKQLIDALEHQKTENDFNEESITRTRSLMFNTSNYVEQLWITTTNAKIKQMYAHMVTQKQRPKEIENLVVSVNNQDILDGSMMVGKEAGLSPGKNEKVAVSKIERKTGARSPSPSKKKRTKSTKSNQE